jgi:hypothetical protein
VKIKLASFPACDPVCQSLQGLLSSIIWHDQCMLAGQAQDNAFPAALTPEGLLCTFRNVPELQRIHLL